MKIHVDMSKCQAYGNCADEAPELFSLDEWGYADVLGEGQVPTEQIDTAKKAVTACPALAIALQNQPLP